MVVSTGMFSRSEYPREIFVRNWWPVTGDYKDYQRSQDFNNRIAKINSINGYQSTRPAGDCGFSEVGDQD
jgi:hypothetical protein